MPSQPSLTCGLRSECLPWATAFFPWPSVLSLQTRCSFLEVLSARVMLRIHVNPGNFTLHSQEAAA